MRSDKEFCEVFLNNRPYRFDTMRRVYQSSSGLDPQVVTMDDIRAGRVHASLMQAYVIGGVPYYYDSQKDELARIGDATIRLSAREYAAVLEIGPVTLPVGIRFKSIVDQELERQKPFARLRPARDRDFDR